MTASSRDTNQIDNDPGGLTENELLTELATLAKPLRRPNGVTAIEMAEAWGVSDTSARQKLNKLEKEGKLYSEFCMDGQHPVRVWYRKL